MKITIEPTQDQSKVYDADCLYSVVSIDCPSDDLHIDDAFDLVVKSLKAWGYHDETIASCLDEDCAVRLGLSKNKEESRFNYSGNEDCGAV